MNCFFVICFLCQSLVNEQIETNISNDFTQEVMY